MAVLGLVTTHMEPEIKTIHRCGNLSADFRVCSSVSYLLGVLLQLVHLCEVPLEVLHSRATPTAAERSPLGRPAVLAPHLARGGPDVSGLRTRENILHDLLASTENIQRSIIRKKCISRLAISSKSVRICLPIIPNSTYDRHINGKLDGFLWKHRRQDMQILFCDLTRQNHCMCV